MRYGTARVGDIIKLWGTQESAGCACGQLCQSMQHVVVACSDCVIHNALGGFAGIRRLDAVTRILMQ